MLISFPEHLNFKTP